jgi:DNA repair exonuclease SbcCD ATPase subunit
MQFNNIHNFVQSHQAQKFDLRYKLLVKQMHDFETNLTETSVNNLKAESEELNLEFNKDLNKLKSQLEQNTTKTLQQQNASLNNEVQRIESSMTNQGLSSNRDLQDLQANFTEELDTKEIEFQQVLQDWQFNIDEDLDKLEQEISNQTLEFEDDLENFEQKSSNLSMEFNSNLEDLEEKLSNQTLDLGSDLDQVQSQMTQVLSTKLAAQSEHIRNQSQDHNRQITLAVSDTVKKIDNAMEHLGTKIDQGIGQTGAKIEAIKQKVEKDKSLILNQINSAKTQVNRLDTKIGKFARQAEQERLRILKQVQNNLDSKIRTMKTQLQRLEDQAKRIKGDISAAKYSLQRF